MKTPSERILEQFVPLMEQQGYAYKKSGHRFVKPFALGTHEFSLQFDGRGGIVSVDGAFAVHFTDLERLFKTVLGRPCYQSAGANFSRAGVANYKFDLFENEFAILTPKQMAQHASDVVHPQKNIDACIAHLLQVHDNFALPLFEQIDTYEKLCDFYLDFVNSPSFKQYGSAKTGPVLRYRPGEANTVYLAILAMDLLGRDPAPLRQLAQDVPPWFLEPDMLERTDKLLAFVHARRTGRAKLSAAS